MNDWPSASSRNTSKDWQPSADRIRLRPSVSSSTSAASWPVAEWKRVTAVRLMARSFGGSKARSSSEGYFGGEETGALSPGADKPAKVEGVEAELLAATAHLPPTTCRAGEGEGERLAMSASPVTDDVVNQPSIVVGRKCHLMTGGSADVETVHPGIPGEDGVDQIAEWPPFGVEGRILPHAHSPTQRSGCAPPRPHGPGGDSLQPTDDGLGSQG